MDGEKLFQEFIEELKNTTSKSLPDWLAAVKEAGISKRNDIIKWLKKSHNFGHMNASLLVGIYLNNGKLVYGSQDELLENQLSKYEIWRPLFEKVSNKILTQFPDTTMIPKKTYVSFTAKREFAAINIKSKEIRLGMDLGDKPFNNILEKAKLTGPMPRISHMVILREEGDYDDDFSNWLNESFKRVYK